MGLLKRSLLFLVVSLFLLGGAALAETDDHADLKKLNKQVIEHYQAGDYLKAVRLAKTSLDKTKDIFGEDHKEYATSLNNLALLQEVLGHYDLAEPLYRQSLTIYEKNYGPDHLVVAKVINNLAALYSAQGQAAKAEPLYKRSVSLYEKASDPDPASFATSLNNLALYYKSHGRFKEAEPLYKRALKLYEKAHGPEHTDIALTLGNLAVLYKQQGEYGKAEPLFKRALAIDEKLLGPDHTSVARTLNNLAKLYVALEKYAEAEDLYKRSLAIDKKTFGPDHKEVAVSIDNLAELYEMQGREREAEKLYLQSLAITEKALGPNHKDVASTLTNLAKLSEKLGKPTKAKEFQALVEAMPKFDSRDIPVLFATSRKISTEGSAITYGAERADRLSLGLATTNISRKEIAKQTIRMFVQDKIKALKSKLINSDKLTIRAVSNFENQEKFSASASETLKNSSRYKDQVLIFVHGYNVGFDEAIKRVAQISYELEFDGTPMLFSWPSSNKLRGYGYDRASAEIAVNYLVEFIENISKDMPHAKIHFMAHSMGNVVVLQALEKLALKTAGGGRPNIGEVVLAHADVDSDRFKQLIKSASPLKVGFTLYSSSDDKALWFSKWLRGADRAGGQAVFTAGLQSIDISGLGTSKFSTNHSIFAKNPIVFGDIKKLLQTGQRPPHKRTKFFEMVKTKLGNYWRYEDAEE